MADKPQSTAEEILEGIGPALDEITVFHNQLLVGVCIKPAFKVLANGQKIYYTEQRADEDRWQGKVGLVLKKGPLAFKDDARNSFHGQDVEVGQWVVFRVNDAPAISINEMHCRLLEDIYVKGVVTNPEIIW